jgi:hypothetical protein
MLAPANELKRQYRDVGNSERDGTMMEVGECDNRLFEEQDALSHSAEQRQ